jgi:hypothetical protein
MKINLERTLRIVLALLAVFLLVAGSYSEYKVYDNPQEQLGLRNFTDISGYQLVQDATFSGTIRIDGDLYSTYNRAAPKGKIACPT